MKNYIYSLVGYHRGSMIIKNFGNVGENTIDIKEQTDHVFERTIKPIRVKKAMAIIKNINEQNIEDKYNNNLSVLKNEYSLKKDGILESYASERIFLDKKEKENLLKYDEIDSRINEVKKLIDKINLKILDFKEKNNNTPRQPLKWLTTIGKTINNLSEKRYPLNGLWIVLLILFLDIFLGYTFWTEALKGSKKAIEAFLRFIISENSYQTGHFVVELFLTLGMLLTFWYIWRSISSVSKDSQQKTITKIIMRYIKYFMFLAGIVGLFVSFQLIPSLSSPNIIMISRALVAFSLAILLCEMESDLIEQGLVELISNLGKSIFKIIVLIIFSFFWTLLFLLDNILKLFIPLKIRKALKLMGEEKEISSRELTSLMSDKYKVQDLFNTDRKSIENMESEELRKLEEYFSFKKNKIDEDYKIIIEEQRKQLDYNSALLDAFKSGIARAVIKNPKIFIS